MILGSVRLQRNGMAAAAGLVAATASILLATASPAEAGRRKAKGGGYAPPYAAMVVDAKTGRTLFAENEDALRHPASVTKVMTLYMLFEQMERGRYTLDSPLQVSHFAASRAPSKLYLKPGSTIAVEDAIKALVTKSANDVATTIAENLAGSESAFAEQMTAKARALGMNRTVFRNASGLPDPAQVTTARDLTILARAIQDRFPRYYPYFQTRTFHFAGRTIGNHNRLLGRVEGVDGIKTGFTRASGFNLMTNAKTDDRHVVAVVLGGRSGASRDAAMASLVRSHLPRAFAGARTAPVVAEAPSRPVAVAEAPRAPEPPRPVRQAEPEATAATPRAPAAARAPLDLNAMRPVVASAAGAASTTTPSSTLRWNAGPQGIPQSAQGFAPVQSAPAHPMPVASASPSVPAQKIDARLPSVEVAARSEPARAEPPRREPERAAAKPAPVSPWVIQLGATDDEGKARSILDDAKSQGGRTLAGASAFTEKVVRDGATLYRARFSGFDEADEAQEACKALKRNGFSCFATRS
jgi:D-alanyl-D-alanine carboxypeptidase